MRAREPTVLLSVLWLLGILANGGWFGLVLLGLFLTILVYRNSFFFLIRVISYACARSGKCCFSTPWCIKGKWTDVSWIHFLFRDWGVLSGQCRSVLMLMCTIWAWIWAALTKQNPLPNSFLLLLLILSLFSCSPSAIFLYCPRLDG